MLKERGQTGNVTGKLSYFATQPPCDAVEASCEAAYPGTSLYRRTLALIRDPNGEPLYLADIFRVAGAKTRDYLFHSLASPEDLAVNLAEPADWTHQPEGCLLGEEVPPMTRAGYGFLFDLHRAHTDGGLKASWEFRKGVSQPDRYLLTRRQFTNCDVRFTMTRTGKARGDRERAVFVFATQPSTVQSRRVIMLPATSLPIGKPVQVEVKVRGGQATMTVDGQPSGQVDVTVIAGDVPEKLYQEVLANTRVLDQQGPLPSHVVVVSQALQEPLRSKVIDALMGLSAPEYRSLMRQFISGIFVGFQKTDARSHLGALRDYLARTHIAFSERLDIGRR